MSRTGTPATLVRFVTGTDTGVGKTVATAALAVALRERGGAPYVVKPAQTGVSDAEPADLDEVRRLAGDLPGHEGVRLLDALAPESAARREGVTLPSLDDQAAVVARAATDHDVLVEGAGGVLVRVGAEWTLLDLAAAVRASGLEVRFVVVARAGLGTLNHAALTVQAIRAAGAEVEGIVIGSWPEEPGLAESENLHDLPRVTGVPVLGRVPEGAGGLGTAEFTDRAGAWIEL